MKQKTLIGLFAVIGLAIYLGLASPGSFLPEAQDSYYAHSYTAPTSVAYGQPITLAVRLDEIGNSISGCDANGPGPRISPSSANYCKSFTYFNARSIRVFVDGKEEVNWYQYPQFNTDGVISTPLDNAGVTDVNGGGPPEAQKAYFYSKLVPWQSSLNGQNLFSVALPQYLPPGQHKVLLYYFSETTTHVLDDSMHPIQLARLSGEVDRDHNSRFNYQKEFTINVQNATVSCVGTMEGELCVSPKDGVCKVGQFENPQECLYYTNSASFGSTAQTISQLQAQIVTLQQQLANNQQMSEQEKAVLRTQIADLQAQITALQGGSNSVDISLLLVGLGIGAGAYWVFFRRRK